MKLTKYELNTLRELKYGVRDYMEMPGGARCQKFKLLKRLEDKGLIQPFILSQHGGYEITNEGLELLVRHEPSIAEMALKTLTKAQEYISHMEKNLAGHDQCSLLVEIRRVCKTLEEERNHEKSL